MRSPLGKLSKEKDGYKVVFDRIFNHPIARVWNAITDRKEIRFWFTDIEMDFRPGGVITFHFKDHGNTISYGEIVAIEPPNRFAWTWEGELAIWELKALDERTTRVIFTYSKLTEDYGIKAAAGFHSLLDQLAERLDGSEEISILGGESKDIKTPVHYAAAVYDTYPKLVRTPPVVVENNVDAPVERVWLAITDKDQMKHWYFDLEDFRPEVGFRFTFPGQGHKGAQYKHLCIVTEVVPLEKLQYSWEYDGYPGYSLVTFTFVRMGNQTNVRLTHHGLESFPQDNDDFAWQSFNGGWNEIIGKILSEFLKKN